MPFVLSTLTLFVSYALISAQQQHSLDYGDVDDNSDDDGDDDDCAFISGQHCDVNGICKYCAMCLQSSCILSKTVDNKQQLDPMNQNSCNSSQFGTESIYDWYDYCLSSGNDSSGDYCATSTECYQYRKSAGPTVTYAWHNLTCNPNTCMLTASNGSPPPAPMPPMNTALDSDNNANSSASGRSQNHIDNERDENLSSSSEHAKGQHHYYHYRNPAMVALTVICSLLLFIAMCWMLRRCRKRHWSKDSLLKSTTTYFLKGRRSERKRWPMNSGSSSLQQQQQQRGMPSVQESMSSIPSTAPPSFSSVPPEMASMNNNTNSPANLYNSRLCAHMTTAERQLIMSSNSNSARSSINSSISNTNVFTLGGESLPSYLTPYLSPPKYEQAIVTQIRGLREDCSNSNLAAETTDPYHCESTAPIPSMWVPIYFTPQNIQHVGGSRRQNVNTASNEADTAAAQLVSLPQSLPIHSYWLQLLTRGSAPNPFDDPPCTASATGNSTGTRSRPTNDGSQ